MTHLPPQLRTLAFHTQSPNFSQSNLQNFKHSFVNISQVAALLINDYMLHHKHLYLAGLFVITKQFTHRIHLPSHKQSLISNLIVPLTAFLIFHKATSLNMTMSHRDYMDWIPKVCETGMNNTNSAKILHPARHKLKYSAIVP